MRSVEGEVVDLALPVNVVEGEKPCTETSHKVLSKTIILLQAAGGSIK